MADGPNLFRVTLEVAALDKAVAFYSRLMGAKGQRIHGNRHNFDCGPVALPLVDPTGAGGKPRPTPDYVYFWVNDIDQIHARARGLGCLSREIVHGESAGEVVSRPWGERSFYADDPFGNALCFVDTRAGRS